MGMLLPRLRRPSCILLSTVCLLLAPAVSQAADPAPKAGPSSNPKVNTLLEYLERDAYGKKLAAPFWVTRAMGVISMARLPQPTVTTKLLEVMEKDKHDIVRLLAWQAILSRAPSLDVKSFQ